MILVTLGTQNNSFHRLLEEVQKCIDQKIIDEEVVVQAGATKFESKDMKIFGLIPFEELNKYVDEANFIITHGGVGSIVTCLKKGKKVIAIPRYHKYGEHVNDHQLQIIETFDGQGFIKGLRNVEDLESAIKELPDFKPNEFVSNTENVLRVVDNYISNKKILFAAYSLGVGGIEKSLVTLVNELEEKGYNITILLEKREGIFLKDLHKNIKIITYCPSENKNKIVRKLRNLFKRFRFILKYRNKFDFSISYAPYSKVASFVSRVASKKPSLWVHTDYYEYYNNDETKFKTFFKSIKYKKFKNIVFVSESAKDNFEKLLGNNNNNLINCNNLIDYKKIEQLALEKTDIEKREDMVTFLNVGRHEEDSKKLSRLIDATEMLIKEGYRLRILLVGTGVDTEKYKKIVDEKKLEDFIIFLGLKENPYPYFKISDCLVLTSEYEGFPVIFLESMTLNLPIITTKVSDYKQIDNKFGLVAQKTTEDIYNKMKTFIENGFEIKEKFNPEEFNNKLLEKIENMF